MVNNMIYSDMHTHGFFSDGKGTFLEFAKSADLKGLVSLGFSDHSPVPLENGWSMKKESLGNYFTQLKEIKEKSFDTDLYAGMELDYIPGVDVKAYIDFENLPLDYFIGSVHYVYSEKLDKYLTVDNSLEDFKYLVNKGFSGDSTAEYKAYYNNVREMICTYKPAIAAHIDLVTKNNPGNLYFDTKSSEYLAEVDKTLDTIKLFGTIVEINTGGMSRGYMDMPYPSEYILRKCNKDEIPVALNSDAHSPGSLTFEFDKVVKMLREIGFKEIITFKKGSWSPIRL